MTDASSVVSGLPGAYVEGLDFSVWSLPAWYAVVLSGWVALKTRRIAYIAACGMLALFASGVTILL